MDKPGPLADLSYRGYDGPLEKPSHRWTVIMRHGIKLAFGKRAYWVLTAFGGWYYLSLIAFLYVIQQVGLSTGQDQISAQFLSKTVWHDQLLNGYSSGSLFFLAIVLILGAGTLANDQQSNALLVYLSKPTTKVDYLVGKWMGVFVPLCLSMLLPGLVFSAYGALNFIDQGFLSQDPWMVPKMLVMYPLMAAFQTSLILGISSRFRQGRAAGAAFAGAYFISGFFATLVGGLDRVGGLPESIQFLANSIQSASVYGATEGIAKLVMNTKGTRYWGIPEMRPLPPIPPIGLIAALTIGGSILCLFIAWERIRAVEVVR